MHVQYLEIVTPDVDATCASLASLHGTTFGEPDPSLGNARTARVEDGSGRTIGVRAPMHAEEQPVVRPYVLVEDIAASVRTAEERGAQIALPPMELPGHGQCAIYFLGGIQYGLWQMA
jgi:predicted enzyme related to lactoylglutathione lyase